MHLSERAPYVYVISAVVNNSQNWGDFKSRYLHWYVDLEIAFATEQSSIIAYFISKIKKLGKY